jgi:ABC-type transport system involved in cytochrome c biogenesis permease subunit
MSPFILRVVVALSALLYISAFSLTVSKKVRTRYVNILWVSAIVINLLIVVNNYVVNGYVPFVSMYQVLTFLAFTFPIVYLYMRYVRSESLVKPYFMLLQSVVMIGVFFMDQNSVWAFPPALQSVFFVPHVFSYMLSYTMVAAASVMAVQNLFKKDTDLEKGIYRLSVTAYPFMISGMLLGALWANECWGEYWQWDAKENWSLLTLLALTLYLHMRREKKLSKYAGYFVIISFVFLIITMFFVGYMSGSSNHSYS